MDTSYHLHSYQSNVCRDIRKIDGLIRQYPFLKNYTRWPKERTDQRKLSSTFQALWFL